MDLKKKLSLIYKIIIVIVSGIGLYLNFDLLGFKGSIIYFTIQSNVLVFLTYLIVVILALSKKLKKGDTYHFVKGMVTMAITITFFVFNFAISGSGTASMYEGHAIASNFVHIFTPLLVMLDYAIFVEKGHIKSSYPFIWSIILVAYLVFEMIYVSLGGTFEGGSKYPYFFIDVSSIGLKKAFFNSIILYVFFVGYGTVVQVVDNKLTPKTTKSLQN